MTVGRIQLPLTETASSARETVLLAAGQLTPTSQLSTASLTGVAILADLGEDLDVEWGARGADGGTSNPSVALRNSLSPWLPPRPHNRKNLEITT